MARIINNHAEAQARWQLKTIRELVAAYDAARAKKDFDFAIIEKIHQHPLSVSVRGHWEIPGSVFDAAEYQIELCWGGPAVRIIGDLEGEQPKTARLEYQDWFTPWEELPTSAAEEEALIEYARFFYFGN